MSQPRRDCSPAAYQAFLEELIREDLDFFFDRAMKESARKEFWLRYLKSIRRTVCVLDPPAYQNLQRGKAALPVELQAALARALKFHGGVVSAFCLWFDGFVVVEFSHTGNAAYIYTRDDFEKSHHPQEEGLGSLTPAAQPGVAGSR